MAEKNLYEMTIEELNALTDEWDRKVAEMLAKKREAAKVRAVLLRTQQAALHGMTPEQYEECKVISAEKGVPLAKVLGSARKDRAIQVAFANAASVGLKPKEV